ncbi:hypothetical protein BGZ57DRAFT_985304 [Hyaloscypha finlandica]|nr:hypothetical protein BGZ57DRAFT_985304 [Hyaloscypha finlandica]
MVAEAVPLIDAPGDFVGQVCSLELLKQKLASKSRAAIVGLPGIGIRKLFPEISVFWIQAAHEQDVEQSYLEIAAAVKKPGVLAPQKPSCCDIKSYLESSASPQHLLIVDNFNDGTSLFGQMRLAELLPKNHKCKVLFTSRDQRLLRGLVAPDCVIHLKRLSTEDGRQLLRNHLWDDTANQKNLTELLLSLSYSPLAIVQAGSFISGSNISVSEYLTSYHKSDASRSRLLQQQITRGFGDVASGNVMEIFLLELGKIESRNPFTSHILKFMACPNNLATPRDLLPRGETHLDLCQSLGALELISMIERRKNYDLYDINPLVLKFVRSHLLLVGKLEEYLDIALEAILTQFPDTFETRESFKAGSSYLPHAQAILRQHEHLKSGERAASLSLLASKGCLLLRERGSYDGSITYAEVALDFVTLAFGPEDSRTLTARGTLAISLRRAGKLAEAELVARDVVKCRKSLVGAKTADIITGMNILAVALQSIGKFAESEEFCNRIIALEDTSLDSNHQGIMKALQNLAITLQSQGKFTEAETIHRRVLSWRERNLGPFDIATLSSISNLGTVLQPERWEEAWEMHTDAFVGRTKILSRSHPECIKSQANMAAVLQAKGEYMCAEPLTRQALELYTDVLGIYHPDTLRMMRNMASLLHCLERYQEAEQISRQAFKIGRDVLGQEHPDTVASKRHADELRSWMREISGAHSEESGKMD